MKRLSRLDRDVVESAPEAYRSVYSRVVGTVDVRCGGDVFKVFVLDDGSYMQSAQPFYLKEEKDWEPVVSRDRYELGPFVRDAFYDMFARVHSSLRSVLPEDHVEIGLDNVYVFCSTSVVEEGRGRWYVVLSNVLPYRWDVWSGGTGSELTKMCYMEFVFPCPAFVVGTVIRLGGSLMQITDIRDSGSCLHNPLMCLSVLPDGVDLSRYDCWGSVGEGK